MKKMFLMVVTATLALVSCSEDQEINKLETPATNNEINFRSFIDKGSNTRATITTESNILGFTVTGWWDKTTNGTGNIANSADGGYLFNAFDITRREAVAMGEWDYDPKLYWPSKGSGVHFFAYSPASSKNVANNKGLYNYIGDAIEYTVPDPSNNESQEDFLLARTGVLTKSPVTFNFAHVLSRATFSARKEPSGLTYLIDSVRLVNINKSGTIDLIEIPTTGSFTYTDTSDPVVGWTPVGAVDSIALDLGNSSVYVKEDASNFHSILGPTNALMVMPQETELGDPNDVDAGGFLVKVSYKAFIDANDPGTYYAGSATTSKHVYFKVADALANNGSHVFEIGRQYNFTLTFGAEAGDPIAFEVAVGDWVEDPDLPAIELPKINCWFDGLISESLAKATNSNYETEGVPLKQIEALTKLKMEMSTQQDTLGLYLFKNVTDFTIVTKANGLDIKIPATMTLTKLRIEATNEKNPTINTLDISTQTAALDNPGQGVYFFTKDDNGFDGRLTINNFYVWSGFTYDTANMRHLLWTEHSHYGSPSFKIGTLHVGGTTYTNVTGGGIQGRG
ncbi:fimbrillin family protein [Parabacteroides sp. PF5-9]|uniref:fimbrillin family protein n=1 Tax=Parabacteroides sp. PF5-9 TaxID=1742404 RepID=UPI002473A59D|nr:fimbrillin family protein [Parabacteroides sp. PF5-9]MDH6357862.1 hypothetical protein [Parabacteroides sp. PF5-9]